MATLTSETEVFDRDAAMLHPALAAGLPGTAISAAIQVGRRGNDGAWIERLCFAVMMRLEGGFVVASFRIAPKYEPLHRREPFRPFSTIAEAMNELNAVTLFWRRREFDPVGYWSVGGGHADVHLRSVKEKDRRFVHRYLLGESWGDEWNPWRPDFLISPVVGAL